MAKVKSKTELYSYRIAIALELAKEDRIDIYGPGWPNDTPNYCGPVDTKLNTQKNYLFSLCIENSVGETGAITEKIFDAFEAGSIPVYLGAPDVGQHIPNNLFINLSSKMTAFEVIELIDAISDDEAADMLASIREYIGSTEYTKFNSEGFVGNVANAFLQIPNVKKTNRVSRLIRSRLFWLSKLITRPSVVLRLPHAIAQLYL